MVNMNDPPTLGSFAWSVAEDAAEGWVLGTVTGADVDGSPLTWEIVSGDPANHFRLDANTGVLSVRGCSVGVGVGVGGGACVSGWVCYCYLHVRRWCGSGPQATQPRALSCCIVLLLGCAVLCCCAVFVQPADSACV